MGLSDETKRALDLTEESSTRSRRIAFLMQIAVILTCMAVWQQLDGTWLNRRLVLAQAAEWSLRCDAETPWSQKPIPNDCGKSLKEKFSSRSSPAWLGIWPFNMLLSPDPPGETEVKAYIDQWHLNIDQAKANVDNLQHAVDSRILAIGIPVLGISVDVNDLSVLSGLSFIVLLSWFAFSLQRYSDNIRELFEGVALGKGDCLGDVYDLLGMTQVLTLPENRDNSTLETESTGDRPSLRKRITNLLRAILSCLGHPKSSLRQFGIWFWPSSERKPPTTGLSKKVITFILWSSFATQLAAFTLDVVTADAGKHLNASLTWTENVLAFLLTAYLLRQTKLCHEILKQANEHWNRALRKAGPRLKPGTAPPPQAEVTARLELNIRPGSPDSAELIPK
jgi:hypothetical protein